MHGKAVHAYQQALAIDPALADAWYHLGNSHYARTEFQNAVDAYQKALQIEPNNADAWSNLGLAYHQLKQYQNAIAAYRQALGPAQEPPTTLVNPAHSLPPRANDETAST